MCLKSDYQPIGGTTATAFAQRPYTAPTALAPTGNELFNGNISHTPIVLSKINSRATAFGCNQLSMLLQRSGGIRGNYLKGQH